MTIELIPKNLDVRSGRSTPIVFHIIGDGHQPYSRGLQGPIIRIPKRWDEFIPNIRTLDCGTDDPKQLAPLECTKVALDPCRKTRQLQLAPIRKPSQKESHFPIIHSQVANLLLVSRWV